jgi:hypothetical protein
MIAFAGSLYLAYTVSSNDGTCKEFHYGTLGQLAWVVLGGSWHDGACSLLA